MNRRAAHAVATLGAGYGVMHWLGRAWGSTAAERHRVLPGDSLVARPTLVTNHAITIDATPARVWPWLAQMGWHRAGWYTARWVDVLLFPANAPSADRIVPELQDLAVGSFVPDGPPETECGFVVTELRPNRALVLHSREHLPLSWRVRTGAAMSWSWSFALDADGPDRTRLLLRSRVALAPAWVAAVYWLGIPADFVMARQMLSGIQNRAERATFALDSGQDDEVVAVHDLLR